MLLDFLVSTAAIATICQTVILVWDKIKARNQSNRKAGDARDNK